MLLTRIPRVTFMVFLAVLICLFSLGASMAATDLNRLKQQLKEAVTTLPGDAPSLHDTLLATGAAFEQAGVYSEARRCYLYLDTLWAKYPPQDPAPHRALKQKIADLKNRQDTVVTETAQAPADDALLLYQTVFYPGQTLDCNVTMKAPKGFWLSMAAAAPGAKGLPGPTLFPWQAGQKSLPLPETPGTYQLLVHDSQGRFLTQADIRVSPPPAWAKKLLVETRGYPGFAGTALRPGAEFRGLIHNHPDWVAGVKGKKPWIGLYKKETPQDSKAYVTYWFIKQQKEFTQISYRIKEAGAYQLRFFDEDSDRRQLLLTVDVTVGDPEPVQVVKGFSPQGPALEFEADQTVYIAGPGFDTADRPDPHCLVVPSWFKPFDIRHGLTHALVHTDRIRADAPFEIRLPGSGGDYDILYYPHWQALTDPPRPETLATARVRAGAEIGLTLPQATYLPGSNIRAGLLADPAADQYRAYILSPEHLQVRADKAGHVKDSRHAVTLEKASYSKGWCWFDITAPLDPGTYVLTLYDKNRLVAAQPLTIAPRPDRQAAIVVAEGPYESAAPFSFKAFPPETGLPRHGKALFMTDGKPVAEAPLYAAHMDFPVTIKAPADPGTYEILLVPNPETKGETPEPAARARVSFVAEADRPRPGIPAIHAQAVAAFGRDDLLPDADLTEFHLFTDRFTPGQDILVSYQIPANVPACLTLVPEGPAPDSLARAVSGAVLVKELNAKTDVATLTAPGPGRYVIHAWDTLQWTKAGPARRIASLPLTVTDPYDFRLEVPGPVYARGDLLVRLHTAQGQDSADRFKTVRLYREAINPDRNTGADVAAASFKTVIDGQFEAVLKLDLEPGKYQMKVENHPGVFSVQLLGNPVLTGTPGIRLPEQKISANGMALAEIRPAAAWPQAVWALAGTDALGKTQFVTQTWTRSGDKGFFTALPAPAAPGQYRLCLWEGTGKETFDKLPSSAISVPFPVTLDPAYAAAHKPAIDLQAYFSPDDRLFAGMNTSGRFTASVAYDRSAWIGILPSAPPAADLDSKTARKSALWALDLSGKDQGDFTLIAPEKPGQYQLCMYDRATDGGLVFSRAIHLLVPDMDRLEAEAEKQADAFLDTLSDPDQDRAEIEKDYLERYKENLEVPKPSPVPVSPDLFRQLQGKADRCVPEKLAGTLLAWVSPTPAWAGTPRDCEADIDLAIQNLRKININFGDGVNVRQVVGELATKMASDLMMGQEHVAKAKEYYDKTKEYYDKAMAVKTSVEENGWQDTVQSALWNSTEAMLKSCATGECLSRLGKKAIEYKLKGYNPQKMTKEEQEAWKYEYTRMVVLLDEDDLKALKAQTAQYADLAGELSVPDADTKALEMARTAAISTMKAATMAMVTKVPGWAALKAYYETLNVLRGGLIDNETVALMDKYRDLRDEGGTLPQVKDILSGQQINYLRESLKRRMTENPAGYKAYLTKENRRRLLRGEPVELSATEIESTIDGYLEKWYQQEKQDQKQDRFYSEMKDAWYGSQCNFESYKAVVNSKNAFDTMGEAASHAYGAVSGYLGGTDTYSSMTCARKALAFSNYMDIRGKVLGQMAGWSGKDKACQPGSTENKRLQDQLVCESLLNPKAYKETMAANALACGELPQPLPPKSSPKVKELSKKAGRAVEVLLKRSGNESILKCLCNRHSVMGSPCSYHPQATKGRSPSCDSGGPPCIQGNWGCFRLDLPTNSASLEACGVGQAIRDFRQKDNAAYQKWLDQRKKYMNQ